MISSKQSSDHPYSLCTYINEQPGLRNNMKKISRFPITEVSKSLSYHCHDLCESRHDSKHQLDYPIMKPCLNYDTFQSIPSNIPHHYKNKYRKQYPKFLHNKPSFYRSHLTKQRIFYYSAYPRWRKIEHDQRWLTWKTQISWITKMKNK